MSRRIVLGHLADGTYGLRVGFAGKDANANPPIPANLIFDSNWPACLPIYAQGSFTITSGQTQTFNFSPALSYRPFCLYLLLPQGIGNTQFHSTPIQQPMTWFGSIESYAAGPQTYIDIEANGSKITAMFQYYTPSGTGPTGFTVYFIAFAVGV